MEEAAGSSIAGEQGLSSMAEKATPPSSTPAPQRKKKWSPEQQKVGRAFVDAALADLNVYMAMTEEDVEEQYRRAGKLDQYEPEKELDKRFARVIKAHNAPQGLVPNIDHYLSLIEHDDY